MVTPPNPISSVSAENLTQRERLRLSPGRPVYYDHHGKVLDARHWTVKQALNVIREVIPTSIMNFDALQAISVAWLPEDKREIIYFLRRNPSIFTQVASLSSQYPEHPEWFNQIQLQQLNAPPVITSRMNPPAGSVPAILRAFSPTQPEQQIQTLMERIGERISQLQVPPTALPQIAPTGQQVLPYGSLLWLAQNPGRIDRLNLTTAQRGQLDALLSPTILRLIEGLARSQNMMLNPDVIRVLVSLLFNPQLHRPGGSLPLASFEKPLVEEPEVEKTEEVTEVETDLFGDMDLHLSQDPTAGMFQKIELSATQIRDLCRHLKNSGGITLEELNGYHPLNEEEEELLRYLRQFSIFHAIADLNGKDETLDPSDLRMAIEDGKLLLDEEHIELVIKP